MQVDDVLRDDGDVADVGQLVEVEAAAERDDQHRDDDDGDDRRAEARRAPLEDARQERVLREGLDVARDDHRRADAEAERRQRGHHGDGVGAAVAGEGARGVDERARRAASVGSVPMATICTST